MLTTIVALTPEPERERITPFRWGEAFSSTFRPIRHVCWKDSAAVATYDHHALGSASSTRVTLPSGLLWFAPKAIFLLTELTR